MLQFLSAGFYNPRDYSNIAKVHCIAARCEYPMEGFPCPCPREFFGFAIFSLDMDNFTARDLWTWRWREETKVITYALKLDTAAQYRASQHVGLLLFWQPPSVSNFRGGLYTPPFSRRLHFPIKSYSIILFSLHMCR